MPSLRTHALPALALFAAVSTGLNLAFVYQLGGLAYLQQAVGLAEPVDVVASLRREALERFAHYPQRTGEVVFVGDSIFSDVHWSEYFSEIRNRGIRGDTSSGVLARLPSVTAMQARELVLGIGTNDLANGVAPEEVARNVGVFVAAIREESPATRVFVISVLPIDPGAADDAATRRKQQDIPILNAHLRDAAAAAGYTFIDAYPAFLGSGGVLKREYTTDGLHLTEAGSRLLASLVEPHLSEPPESADPSADQAAASATVAVPR